MMNLLDENMVLAITITLGISRDIIIEHYQYTLLPIIVLGVYLWGEVSVYKMIPFLLLNSFRDNTKFILYSYVGFYLVVSLCRVLILSYVRSKENERKLWDIETKFNILQDYYYKEKEKERLGIAYTENLNIDVYRDKLNQEDIKEFKQKEKKRKIALAKSTLKKLEPESLK